MDTTPHGEDSGFTEIAAVKAAGPEIWAKEDLDVLPTTQMCVGEAPDQGVACPSKQAATSSVATRA